MNGPGGFRTALSNARRVHLDGRVLAFHLIGDPRYTDLTRTALEMLGDPARAIKGQTSAVSLYQILVEVYRRTAPGLADRLSKALLAHSAFDVLPVTADIAIQAAQVRAQLGGRTERSLQIATALASGADTFLTEGSGIRRIVGMSVLNLEDFAEPASLET